MTASTPSAKPKIVGSYFRGRDTDGRFTLVLPSVEIGTKISIQQIVVYSNGTMLPAINVNWTLPLNVLCVSDFSPTPQVALPLPAVTTEVNPITFVPWQVIGPFVSGQGTPTVLIANGQDPMFGEPVTAQDTMLVTNPDIVWNASPTAGNAITIQNGATDLLQYATPPSYFYLNFNVTSCPAGSQFALVQLVNTLRRFTMEDGSTWDESNSNGSLFCDYRASEGTFYVDAAQGPGEFEFDGQDLPQQPLYTTKNGKEVVSCNIAETFEIFIFYRASTLPFNQYDPQHVWAPVCNCYLWGWTAFAQVEDEDWLLEQDQYVPLQTTPPDTPQWLGSIPDRIIDGGNGSQSRAKSKRTKSKRAKSKQTKLKRAAPKRPKPKRSKAKAGKKTRAA